MPRFFKSEGCAAAGWPRLKDERGSTLVEFAFVFMILMTMILGIMEFSRALYAYHFVSSAARQATRFAAVHGSTCADDGSCTSPASSADYSVLTTFFNSTVPPGIDTSSATLSMTPTWPVNADSPVICAGSAGPPAVAAVENAPGCTVQVQVSYNFNFLVPFIHSSPLTLSSTSEMIISH